jgi:Ca-activated chloride channel family protein
MKLLVSILAIVLAGTTFSQTEINKSVHNFGELMVNSDRFVDIQITNKGIKKEYLLSVKKPREVVYIVDGQFIEKDSMLTVRLQVNPKEKGNFNYEVEIFTSDRQTAFKVKLKGELKETPKGNTASFQACPSFGQRATGADPTAFELTIVTIDKDTKEPIGKSKVSLIQNGKQIEDFQSNKSGQIVEEVPLGYTYFYARATGYKAEELGTYVNFQRNYIVIELEKKQVVEPEIVEEIELPVETEIEIAEEEKEEEIELESELTQELILPSETPFALQELDPNNFDTQYFDPVNVTFVLDVSSSMRQGDKIELMKFALYELNDMLRGNDKISIVTYADNARVILKPNAGSNKESTNESVEKLKASGLTAGGEGIKLGYKQNLKGQITDGKNHVIVITDGAFNRNSDDYKRYVRRYKKKGISLSIVGIKNSEKDALEMKEAASLGGGRYIPIDKLVDAQNNLKQEIRLLTFKN